MSAFPVPPEALSTLHPLRPNQKRYVLAERFTPACYMISVCHRVEGPLDPERMRRAADALVARHAALRTAFLPVDGSYHCQVFPTSSPQFHIVEVADDSFAAFRAAALPLILRDVDVGSASSLVRFVLGRVAGAQVWRVCFASHHAVSDGVSRSLAMKQLFAFYDGKSLPPARSFYDAVRDGPDHEDDRAYWTGTLAALQPVPRLIPDVEPAELPQFGRFVEDRLNMDAGEYRRLAAKTKASSFGCMAAVYALGLSRLLGQLQPVFAFQSAGRPATPSAMSIFGPFSNTLPLAADLDLSMTFAALAKEMQQRTAAATSHERMSFDQILRLLPGPLDFSLNAFPREHPPEADGLAIHAREFLDRQSEFAINLVWSQDGSEMVARAYYDAGRVSQARVADFLRVQKLLLQAGLQRPDALLRDLLAGAGGAPAQIAARYREPPATSVIDRVVAVARTAPETDAIRHGAQAMSYGALLARADAYGTALLAAGARPTDRVAILGSRSADLVAACLGAARAGVTLAVLDPRYPEARIAAQAAMLRPRFLLCPGAEGSPVRALPGMTPLHPAERGVDGADLPGPRPGVPLYTLFTSGTTGQPKAVGHGYEVLTFFTDWARERFAIGPDDCVTMLSGLNHDPVMRDIFLPLSSGACLAIPDEEDMADPARLRGWMQRAGVTITNLTPPMGQVIAMGAGEAALPRLRLLIWGGDELRGRQVRRFRALAPGAVQVNLYGATETPQAAALSVIVPDAPADWRTAPVGRAVDWMGTDCVTADGRICGPGETGFLRVSLPFPVRVQESGTEAVRETRLHETGDRAYVAADGQFIFLGRNDDQVKIRGFRVDLTEVSAALEGIPGVRRALVLPQELADGARHLHAWCEREDGHEADSQALAVALRRMLPEHMVPQRIYPVTAFPLLANGKIDRATLAELGARQDAAPRRPAAQTHPLTAGEARIAALFARITGRGLPTAADSLALLGADSLSMIEARLALEVMQADLPRGWEALPISAIAARLPGSAPKTGLTRWMNITKLESFVAVRAVAIVLIVSTHMGLFFYGGGATVLLFMIAGFTFGTFTLPAILADDSPAPLWRLIGKVLVTIYAISLLLVAWQFARHQHMHPSTLGLFANFVSDTEATRAQGYVFWLWYIHSYLQAFFLMAVALSFAGARQALRDHGFGSTLGLALACAMTVLAVAIGHGGWTREISWTDPVARLPIYALTMIGLGLAARQAGSLPSKLGLLAATLAIALTFEHVFEDGHPWLMVCGMAMLLFIPVVPVPALLGRVMLKISGASLFIYAMHWPLAIVAWDIWWNIDPVLLAVGDIAVCVLLWSFWQPVLRWLFDRRRPDGRREVSEHAGEVAI